MELKSYAEILTHLQQSKRNINLLLGNGFSMAYDHEIFSYNALHNYILELDDKVLRKLFDIVGSKNLEIIMRQLRVLNQLLEVFPSSEGLRGDVIDAETKLRQGLIDAINALHPEHVFTVPEAKIQSCMEFLNPYLYTLGGVFSTNYDVLLYWVLMRGGSKNSIDGFGRISTSTEQFTEKDFAENSKLVWGPNKAKQNVHFLHGALHIFDAGIDIEKEHYDESGFLLDHIKERMDSDEYPVFVTAGSSDEKLAQIVHNRYLTYCFERLSSIEGSLVTFGFNFGSYDEHIISAINKASKYSKERPEVLRSVYIGVYSKEDIEHIKSIEHKFNCKVRIFDSKTANVWGTPA